MARGQNCAKTNRTAPYDDHGGFLDLLRGTHLDGTLDTIETRGEDVGHEQEGFIRNGVGRLYAGTVGQRHSHVLGLTSIEGLAPKQFTLNASGGEAVVAVEAITALV